MSIDNRASSSSFGWRVYDLDGNGCLDANELGRAIGDYYDRLITEEQVLEAQSHVCQCTPRSSKCAGYDLYICDTAGYWRLWETNSPSCGYTFPPLPCVSARKKAQAVNDFIAGRITKEQVDAILSLPTCFE